MRISIWLGILGALAVTSAEATEPNVSVVVSQSIEPYLEASEGIQEALQAAGMRVGFDLHDMRGDPGEGARIAAELMKRKPSLIITVGTEASRLISEQTEGIPIIVSMVIHAEALVVGGKSVGGVSMEVSALEQLRVLPDVLPAAKRVGLVYNPALHEPEAIGRWQEAARQLGLELAIEPVEDMKDLPSRLQTLLPAIDAFWLIPDETALAPQTIRHIMLETLRRRIPVFAPSLRFVQEGALAAVACDYRDVGRQAGELAAHLLSGRTLDSGRLLDARKSKLYLNLKIAKTLDIVMPASLMTRADHVVR